MAAFYEVNQHGVAMMGVTVSHGNDITMSMPLDQVETVNWDNNYTMNPDGSRTFQMVCIIETVTGDIFRFGARTLTHFPWVVPAVNGKGRGRGAMHALAGGASGSGGVPPPPAP